jgi:hypothetical protein
MKIPAEIWTFACVVSLLAVARSEPASTPVENSQSSTSSASQTAAAHTASELVKSQNADEVVITPNESLVESIRIEKEARNLLLANRFEEIERRAAQYRHTKAMYADGFWKLGSWYRGLGLVPRSSPDAQWTARIKKLQAWIKQKPKSITAHIALARAYHDGAYRARGGGWADSVSDAQWKLMYARLDQAAAVLEKVKSQRAQCPGWYAAALRIAKLQNWDRADFTALANEGLRYFPQYHDFHYSMAEYLLPRWFGLPGDWEKYAENAAKRVRGEASDILYARIVYSLQLSLSDVFGESNISWDRAKRGYAALLKHYPCAIGIANGYAQLAAHAKDRELTKTVLEKYVKNRMDPEIWASEQDFIETRNWAYGTNN